MALRAIELACGSVAAPAYAGLPFGLIRCAAQRLCARAHKSNHIVVGRGFELGLRLTKWTQQVQRSIE